MERLELGSWVSRYFEDHRADYFERDTLVPIQEGRGRYIRTTEGGFVVGDGQGGSFVYSQVERQNGSLITNMTIEWEFAGGGTFRPFGIEVVEEKDGNQKINLKIQALDTGMFDYAGVNLSYENNCWSRSGGIWVDGNMDLDNWPRPVFENIPISDSFEYCVPVNLEETLTLWLANLERGDFSMPVVVPARSLMIGVFEWQAPYRGNGATYFPENTDRLMKLLTRGRLDSESWGEILREVMKIESAINMRFMMENNWQKDK